MQHAINNVVLFASTLSGDVVVNQQGEDLGKIEDLLIDFEYGRIAYVVVSFRGFLGIADKLLAIPWDALSMEIPWNALYPDPKGKKFILDVNKEHLKNAPGFDKDHWPQMADRKWGQHVHNYYGCRPYWEWLSN